MTLGANTLYVTTEGAYVSVEGEMLRIRVEKETRLEVPMHHLSALVTFTPVGVSPAAMHACSERGIAVVFFGPTGKFLARVEGPTAPTATLRRRQYRIADDQAARLPFARAFVAGKIANARSQLQRAGRTRGTHEAAFDAACERLSRLGEKALDAADEGSLLGIEGEAAARYFELFDAMLGSRDLTFEKRSRRPPTNPVNALLSFGYALLSSDCVAALHGVGLDPAVGFFHTERSRRPALALDLMEELRHVVVDRMVLAILRLKQLGSVDFTTLPTNEVNLKDAARKAFLVEYQERKKDVITHPLTGETTTWGMVPHIQARLLARAVRGEYEYVPMLVK